ncbi:DUF4133 domain-containing protein [Mucilaginibacter sabulilitoris]|uniref:DUF4133 domain-containing protein n=1 Tax=Mucilaginibacter sabulilitoris TaxID=1173583 RepID=A0ABZ0TSM7_9SPHI|nr:DUF4133 domain-containing protein [Mucilaginibacter sabulilitoris]WPU95766.1 DUF4133 domain-containing protein [Mucilaginibacter sabulilitoris]
MMKTSYPVYKGLQQPLVYRGFKGRFIAWGIASLVIGLVTGGLIGTLTSMYFGGFLTILLIVGGLGLTFQRQKAGLYAKSRATGVFIHPVKLKLRYGQQPQKKGI